MLTCYSFQATCCVCLFLITSQWTSNPVLPTSSNVCQCMTLPSWWVKREFTIKDNFWSYTYKSTRCLRVFLLSVWQMQMVNSEPELKTIIDIANSWNSKLKHFILSWILEKLAFLGILTWAWWEVCIFLLIASSLFGWRHHLRVHRSQDITRVD